MFQSARIKLTIWYVLISVFVSVVFSVAIFSILHRELVRDETRFQIRFRRLEIDNPGFMPNLPPPQIHDIEGTEDRIKMNLLYVNLAILGIASLAGYFLAGRTLRPIQEMVDKQGQFIADASHELRTPLTALRTGIEVNLRDKNLDVAQAKQVLKENLEDVDKLRNLSENLLILATLQKNPKVSFKQVDLAKILSTSIDHIETMAKQKNIAIKPSLNKVIINGNEDQLTDLFVIFFDNAIKYSSPNSQINVILKKIDSKAEITIQDQGIGMSKQNTEHIFERFYRIDASRSSTGAGGYGLGLAIAKEIINAHQGTVSVESKLKKGTIFRIEFPTKN